VEDWQITCDTCGRDLTKTSYEEAFRLNVSAHRMMNTEGATFSMSLPPPVERAYHFCDLKCLRKSSLIAAVDAVDEGGGTDHEAGGEA
jgi:hypothetical protein